MYYYKYCSPGDRQFGMLSRGELFFASAEELNDGSECRPRYVLKGSAELWTRLCEYVLFELWICQDTGTSAQPSFPKGLRALSEPLGSALNRRAARRDLDYDQLWPALLQDLPRLLRGSDLAIPLPALPALINSVRAGLSRLLHENLYMACFSRSPSDPTMWGHYGGAERGFCIIVRAAENKLRLSSPANLLHGTRPSSSPGITEIGIYRDAEVQLESVRYRSAPPRINAFHRLIPHFHYSEEEDHYDVPLLISGGAPDRQEKLFGLVKALTWKYEKEARAFLPSNDDLTPEARCLQLNWDQIQGIIFGPKMSNAHKERTIVSCHLLRAGRSESEPRSSPFIFLNARQRVDSFQMAVSPVGVLHGYYATRLRPILALRDADRETVETVRGIVREMENTPDSIPSKSENEE